MIFKFGSIYLNKHGGVFFDMQCSQRKRIFDSVKVSESLIMFSHHKKFNLTIFSTKYHVHTKFFSSFRSEMKTKT